MFDILYIFLMPKTLKNLFLILSSPEAALCLILPLVINLLEKLENIQCYYSFTPFPMHIVMAERGPYTVETVLSREYELLSDFKVQFPFLCPTFHVSSPISHLFSTPSNTIHISGLCELLSL